MYAALQPTRLIRFYYAGTVVFLLLDFLFNLNVRIAFLEGHAGLRAAYYGICFVCLALVIWRPAWTAIVGAFESLVSLVALILSFGIRAIFVTDAMIEGTQPFVSVQEVVNFLLAGTIGYLAWMRGIREIQRNSEDFVTFRDI